MRNSLISSRLKELCKTIKMPMKELLNTANVNRNFIYDLEHKETAPTSDKLESLADVLDCSVDYLLGRTDNPQAHKAPIQIKVSDDDANKVLESVINSAEESEEAE